MSLLHTSDDLSLIEKIRKDDHGAFKVLFSRYYKVLLGTSLTMLHDVDSAKDVTQEVFFQIWKNRKTVQIKTEVVAYLKRAVINRSINQIHHRKRNANPIALNAMSSKSMTPDKSLENEEFQAMVYESLDALPDRCRLIFTMKRIEGMRVKQIADELSISTKTVENQLTKALKILKEKITLNVLKAYSDRGK